MAQAGEQPSSATLRQQFLALPWRARMSVGARPGLIRWGWLVGAILLAGLGIGMLATVGTSKKPGAAVAEAVLIGFAIAMALLGESQYRWVRSHPDQVAEATSLQNQMRRSALRAHPMFYMVVMPILVAAGLGLRLGGQHHSWLAAAIAAVAGLLIIVPLMVWQVRRARRG